MERGCAHPEKTNRTMSYRTGPQIITLTETVCASDLCNKPTPGQAAPFPRSRYLECASCASSDMSCERRREQSLQCRHPGDQCLEVVSHRSQEGEPQVAGGKSRHRKPRATRTAPESAGTQMPSISYVSPPFSRLPCSPRWLPELQTSWSNPRKKEGCGGSPSARPSQQVRSYHMTRTSSHNGET